MGQIIRKLQDKMRKFFVRCFEESCSEKFIQFEKKLEELYQSKDLVDAREKEWHESFLRNDRRLRDLESTLKTFICVVEKKDNEQRLSLEDLSKQFSQCSTDEKQLMCYVEKYLPEVQDEMENLLQKSDSFFGFYYPREKDLQNCIDYLQEKVEYIIKRQYELETLMLTVVSGTENTVMTLEEIRNTKRYQYLKQIHELTQVKKVNKEAELIRVGRDFDGGYIMANPISSEKIAYSIGINDDVSWDLGMAQMGYDVYQYDHTIQKLPVDHENFHWKKIGLGAENKSNFQTLEKMMSENGHTMKSGMVLKIDIEGGEWEALNNCSEELLSKFDQIILELHGLVKLQSHEIILKTLELLSRTHFVAHIHGNNYGCVEYCGDLMTPNLLEVTYLNKRIYSFTNRNGCIESELDRPNRSDIPDIHLNSW